GQHRPGMSLVQPLVRRETDVAVDTEYAVPGIAGQRHSGFAQSRPDRDDQLAERSQHFGLVYWLVRLEPGRVVVVTQFAEERERSRSEPGKLRRGFRHSFSPVPLRRA